MMILGLIVAGAGGFVLLCFIDALLLAWSGYALSVLWGWFAVPIYGLPALSIPQAIGTMLVTKHLTGRYIANKGSEWYEQIAFSTLFPAVGLLIGWIVLKFM